MVILRTAAVLLLVALFLGCGQKSAGLQEGATAPDTQLFENGMQYLEKSQYIKARLSFQTLINTYPDSEYTPASFLAIADSYYAEGGSENLLQAEAQYKDFLIFYPTHEMADDAQLKIAAINYRLMKPYDRDPTNSRKAEIEFKRFLDNYPDSELAPTAREALKEVEDSLARRDHDIGEFYFKRGSYNAAASRYEEVVLTYPSFRDLDVTLFKYGRSLEEVGRVLDAGQQYEKIVREYPHSTYFEAARERLVLLEQNVPDVDQEAAARNLANQVPEKGFSVTDPIRNVWQVFTGRPDIYEIARKRADAQGVQGGGGLPPSDQQSPQE